MKYKIILLIIKQKIAGLIYLVFSIICERARVFHAKFKSSPLPLPELGIDRGGIDFSAGKGVTSFSKWQLIESALPQNCKTAIDIGSNNGFFSLRLAGKGIFTSGFEPDEELLHLAVLAVCKTHNKMAAFSPLPISPESVKFLPHADVSLVLSVAQRWVHIYGREGMEAILESIWDRTHCAMFFELPNPAQSTKEAKWLEFLGATEEEAEQAIEKMLLDLGAKTVKLLGYLPTDFRPDEKRHLFVALK